MRAPYGPGCCVLASDMRPDEDPAHAWHASTGAARLTFRYTQASAETPCAAEQQE